ncbi:putative Ig domain-containing protein [Sphingomonas sp. R86521]|uniref:putative Ig domain-containing protein n=1 Tax=Sphingomonas sp. R86521 TaxID=3093860 RepID=UPI0036D3A8E4
MTVLVLAWLALAGASAAQAQSCTLVYGAGGPGSGTLNTLRVDVGVTKRVAGLAEGDVDSPAAACGGALITSNTDNTRMRITRDSDSSIAVISGAYTITYDDGGVLEYSGTAGAFYSYTAPSGSGGTQRFSTSHGVLTASTSAAVPAGSTGTFQLYVGTPATATAPTGVVNLRFDVLSALTITGLSPTSGPTTGSAVTIAGTGFSTAGNTVTFGGTAGAITAQSSTSITVTAPAHAAGSVTVIVSTAQAQSATSATSYTYIAAPTVTAVAPSTGPATGQTTVTLTGTGFIAGSTVLFGTTAATAVTINSATQITAVSPAGTGTVGVSVVNTGGTGTLAAAFTYANPPTVSAVTPASGPASGNASVVITGTNFTGATAVTFGATPATGFTVNSATQITAVAPAGSAGAVPVGVTTPSGSASLANGYTYVVAPTVSSVAPSSGPIAGGTAITITGTNFTGATAVTVGGVPATGVTITSATQITATTPAAPGNAAGAVAVAVTTGGGTGALAGGFTYVATPTAAARSVSTAYNQPVTVDLSSSITGSYTVVNLVTGPAHGTLAPGAPGNYQSAVYQPTAGYVGPDSYTYTATGAGGTSTPAIVSITVGAPTIAITPATLPAGQAGAAYNQILAASGGAAPYAFSATGLPTGLTLSAGGVVSGTPTQAGSFTVTVTAQDSSTGAGPFTGSRTYTLVIAAPTITLAPPTSPSATVGVAYSQTISAAGGAAPYEFAITAGALPAGLTLAAAGALSGTPSAGGSFAFTVTATDATAAGSGGPYTASRSYSLTVAAPSVTLTPATLPGGEAGVAYSQALTAAGGTAPYGYVVSAGALPTGLTLSASGTLSGAPSASGSFAFSVTATDSSGGSGPYAVTRSYTLAIGAPTLTLAPTTLAGATVGAAYSASITATGGTAPYGYAITAGALPAGLTLAANGTLAGTPIAGGSFAFTITATDATPAGSGGPYTAARSYSLTVAAPSVTLTPATLPAGEAGIAYSQALSAAGGTAPYAYAITAGALPTGLTLSASGTLSGAPSASGSFAFSVTATDSSIGSGPYAVTRSYTLVIGAPTLTLAPTTLTGTTVGAAYSASITATGGTAPYGYAITAGALPAGLTLAADGTLAGTSSAGGTFTFAVTATDATPAGSGGPYTTARAYSLTVAAPNVTLSPATLPAGQAGTPYSQALSAGGGTAPYAYVASAGALPAGLTLSASGTLSGTPSASGSFAFSVTATDSSGGSGPYAGTRSYTLVIGAPTLILAPTTLTGATVGSAYSASITATGGTAPYGYAITAGALPAGLSLAANGTLAGTPSAGGSFAFTVTATDATAVGSGGPYTASRSYSLTVAAPSVTLSPATLPAGQAGTAYSQALSAAGGTAPYGYAVTAGALPAGVTLSASGTLAGTPSESGSFAFSVTATDSSSGSGPYASTRSYTLVIGSPTLALAPASLIGATVGASYSASITAIGGTAPYGYAITAGALPAGLTLAAGGTLSGTPNAGGSFAFTVTATDATAAGSGGPYTASRSYSLTVAAPSVALSPASLPAGQAGIAYSQALSATGGTAPYGYAVTAGALPAGVTLSASGTLAGTPSASGSFAFSVTATDSSGGSGPYAGTRSYTFVVGSPTLTLAPTTLSGASVGAAYSASIIATGGTAPYGYSITAGALPAGLTLAANGTLAGTPTVGGSFAFTVTATDATAVGSGGPYTAARAYSLTVAAPSVTLSPVSLPAGQAGIAYSQALSATGGTAPYGYAVTAGALPAGVTLSASGTLAGTPSASGSFAFSVTATDSSGGTGPYAGTRSYTLVIGSPTMLLAPATVAGGTVGAAYSASILAIGGTAPYGFAITAGALPAGVTLAANGTLSGTPSAGGSFAFTVTATDATPAGSGGPYTASRAYSLTVAVPSVTLSPASLPAGHAGTAYSQTLSAAGGTAPYGYALGAGALPAGLTLAAGGTLAGTPTTSGSFTFSVTATDSSGGTGPYAGTRSYTLVIAAPTLALGPAAGPLPSAAVGSAYSQLFGATGGTGPYSFKLSGGALPTGLALASNGTVSGTPTVSGSFGFDVTLTDAGGPGAGTTQHYTLAVLAPTIILAPATLASATVGTAYDITLAALGGIAPYSYAVTGGSLPAGLGLDGTGRLAGTPVAGGSFTFTVTATDASTGSGSHAGTRTYNLTVGAAGIALTPPALSDGIKETAYRQAFTASGGTAPYTVAVTAGTLPAGLVMGPDGVLAGTPTTIGSFAFTVTAVDASTGSGPYSKAQAYSVRIGAPAAPTAGDTSLTVAYGAGPTPTPLKLGGPATTYVALASKPEHGIVAVSRMAMTYAPAAGYVGGDSFSYTAANEGGASTPAIVTVIVTPPAAPTVAGRAVATAYGTATAIDLSGAITGVHATVTVTTAPAHGTTSVAGDVVTYTPAAGYFGADSFPYVAVGAGGTSAPATVTITVGTPPVPIVANRAVTTAYGAAISVDLAGSITGVHGSVTVASGPAHGTTSVAGDVVTYTPAAGYYGADTVGYTATGPGGTSAPATVTITVGTPPVPTVADRAVSTAYGAAASIDLTAAILGVHTSIAIASNPAHGTTSISGDVVTYSPVAGYYGPDSFTYAATGPGGTSAPATVTVTIAAPTIVIAPASLPAGQQGTAYTAALSASGGAAPYRYAVTGGVLPTGLTLTATGALAGTPTQNGSFAITITATDSSTGATPASAARSYTLVIAAPAPPVIAGTAVTVTTPAGGTKTVDVTLSNGVSGDWTAIEIASQPAHGTVTLTSSGAGAGGHPVVIASYTPILGYRGQDGFTVVATGPGGRSAPATVAVTVLGSAPVAATLSASTGQNVPVTIDLTTQARGAPYTAAAIVSVGPAAAATAALIEGGSVDNRTYQLRITPDSRYSGTIVVTYTLSNAVGASAAATATVTVTARADPAADPTVRGLIAAQAEATRSFAATQLGNFARRNETLHGGGAGSTGRPFGVRVANGLGLVGGNYGGYRPSAVDHETALKMEHATEVAGAEGASGRYNSLRTGAIDDGFGSDDGAGLGTAGGFGDRGTNHQSDSTRPGMAGSATGSPSASTGERSVGSIAIWSGGAITVGSRDATTRRVHLDVTSGGLSAGSDIKLADALTVGIGGGYGSQRTRIGDGAARLDGDNWVGALYGSLAPIPGAFIDGVIGYGGVDFDSRRLAANGEVGVGHRNGTMRFGSIATGLDRHGPSGMVSAYGRVEYLSATLDGYRETGAGLYNLAYGRRELDSLSSVLGGRGALYRAIDFGVISPRARFEWRHEYRGQGGQLLDYADLGGLTRVVEGDRWLRDEYSLELGIGLQTDTDWTFGIDFGGRLGSDSRVGTARAMIGKKF